jgi:hypothetical protein
MIDTQGFVLFRWDGAFGFGRQSSPFAEVTVFGTMKLTCAGFEIDDKEARDALGVIRNGFPFEDRLRRHRQFGVGTRNRGGSEDQGQNGSGDEALDFHDR